MEINKNALMDDGKCISVHVIAPGMNVMGILIRRYKLMSLIRKCVHSQPFASSVGPDGLVGAELL